MLDLGAVLSPVSGRSRHEISFKDYVANYSCTRLTFIHSKHRGRGRELVDNSGPWTHLDGSRVNMFRAIAPAVNGVDKGSVGRE